MTSKVIVKNGRTINLVQNYPAIDGDAAYPAKIGISSPVLPDGRYSLDGFERVLQTDDQPPNKIWQQSFDEQYDLRTNECRNTLYFFKENVGKERRPFNVFIDVVKYPQSVEGYEAPNSHPLERLRNILTPYTNLVQLLKYTNVERKVDTQDTKGMIEQELNKCVENLSLINQYLTDCETFYINKQIN